MTKSANFIRLMEKERNADSAFLYFFLSQYIGTVQNLGKKW